jgi:hypothetical protein
MRVSVCIPTFNSAKYLRECIDSVLVQTYTDFELVISDDASTDNTRQIVDSYSDPRMRFERLDQNVGVAANLNHVASLARGAYIKLLCSDDWIERTCLEQQVAALERHPEAVMVTCGIRRIDAAGRILREVSRCPQEAMLRDADIVAGNLVYGNVIGLPSATLIRRECLMKAGPFSPAFPLTMDVELWLRLAALGPVGYLPEVLCRARTHPQAVTVTLRLTGASREDVRRMTDKMLATFQTTVLARRIGWGRVAASFLKQAWAGFRQGELKQPLAAIGEAFLVDPGFAGLAAFLAFFDTGILGLAADGSRKIGLRFGRTLHD